MAGPQKRSRVSGLQLNRLAGRMLCARLGTRHGELSAFRVLRIERAYVDVHFKPPKDDPDALPPVSEITARVFNAGEEDPQSRGWEGRKLSVVAEEFTGAWLGVEVRRPGHTTEVVPVNDFVRRFCVAGAEVPEIPPPLAEGQSWVKLSVEMHKRLTDVLAMHWEELTKPGGLPDEPQWTMACPDKALIHFAPYPVRGDGGKIDHYVLQLIGYTAPDTGVEYVGSTLSSSQVAGSLRTLFRELTDRKKRAGAAAPGSWVDQQPQSAERVSELPWEPDPGVETAPVETAEAELAPETPVSEPASPAKGRTKGSGPSKTPAPQRASQAEPKAKPGIPPGGFDDLFGV